MGGRNAWFSDIWFDLKGIPQELNKSPTRVRSAAYPFELAYRLINMYSIQGDTVLDPFLGTGTTTLAAMASCRNSVGYELDKDFLEVIQERIQDVVSFSNTYIQNRIKNHEEFVKNREKENKSLNYVSEKYGFKVMTSQETKLIFPFLKVSNKITDTRYEVIYTPEADEII